ncbi:glycosyltransferase [Ekhidna sp.]|uniref:glycosyltransferase n=1 Tax=Ekhidna sp. TaxID=2608089 RepID=UPI003513507A
MNLFIVPSWYPSASNPSYGIFIQEQVAMMSRLRPDWKIGVSTWGQGDSEKLIWVKDHIKNFGKISRHGYDKASLKKTDGIVEYYQPALSWTKRFRKGNLREIIRCNELNYQGYTLEHGKPDVIVVQACYPGALIGDYLSKKYDVPVHLHVRLGGFMFEKMILELGTMRRDLLDSISRFKLITTTSNFHRGEVEKWIPESKVLYNPVDTTFFSPAKTRDDFVLAIGRLEPEKGFELLLEAIHKVDGVNIKIIGSGSKEPRLRSKIKELKLESKVELLGEKSREEVRNYLQRCQFLVLPSHYETFGNVLLEAMACGRPVVSTKCGGPNEIISDEVGFLSSVDADDLADKIKAMRDRLSTFPESIIRKKAEDLYSPDVWIGKLESLLKEMS